MKLPLVVVVRWVGVGVEEREAGERLEEELVRERLRDDGPPPPPLPLPPLLLFIV